MEEKNIFHENPVEVRSFEGTFAALLIGTDFDNFDLKRPSSQTRS
jgi:hypothetical protein